MVDVSILLQQVTAAMAAPRHATYRLQLGAALGFEGVADLAPYLSALGVSDAYLSPCFKCGPGSSHGYDVTDHNAFNPEVGSAATFDRMAAALAARGLGIILDIVPNHMGIAGDANPWWLDVLENGPSSPRAAFFDIDWTPVKPELRNTVLLPILPDQYGRVLEAQQLEIELSEGAFFVRHAGARLPLCPDSYPQILTQRLETLAERLHAEHAGLGELRSILTTLEHLPGRIERHTSWINPNAGYDVAVGEFVTRLLAPGSPFLDAVRPFRETVALYGAVNSLAQALLKIAAPGVPDFYQGSELWDLSLVDPDNRRPVDFGRRQAMLDDLRRRIAEAADDLTVLCAELLESWPVGMVKLYLTHRALTLRRAHPRLFGLGAYLPLAATGERAEHVVSLARQDGPDVAVVAVPRLAAHLTGFTGRWPLGPDVWGTTRLSLGDPGLAGVYRDRFSGLRLVTESQDGAPALPAMALFAAFPVALLEREEARHER